jgi:sporulation protein YlmC with PRC-barrel domain
MKSHQISHLLTTSAASVLMLGVLAASAPAQSPTSSPAQPSAAPVAAAPMPAPASAPPAQTPVAATPAQAVTSTTPAPQATAAPAPANTAPPSAQPGSTAASSPVTLTPTLSAVDIQGLDVFGSEGQQVGRVTRVNQADGAVKSIDVQSNGFFGFFKKTYEIPATAVKKNGAKIELSMTSSEATRNMK